MLSVCLDDDIRKCLRITFIFWIGRFLKIDYVYGSDIHYVNVAIFCLKKLIKLEIFFSLSFIWRGQNCVFLILCLCILPQLDLQRFSECYSRPIETRHLEVKYENIWKNTSIELLSQYVIWTFLVSKIELNNPTMG